MDRPKSRRRAVDGFLLLDKPSGLTSNAALQRVKWLFSAEKAGHTGSLDPMATGLLPICFGQATKLSAHLLDAGKAYRAQVRLGIRTDTGDADGRPIAESSPRAGREAFETLLSGFTGEILQVPPMYSAIKRDGFKLYQLAREGIEIEREPRPVTIRELRLTAFEGDRFEFEVHCSKGTYVRTLAEDWAAAAGEYAHLSSLRRIGLGGFEIGDAVDLATLEACADAEERARRFLRPSLGLLAHWPRVRVTPQQERELRAGSPVGIDPATAAGLLCVIDGGGSLIWLGEHDGRGGLAPRRWLGRDPVAPAPERLASTARPELSGGLLAGVPAVNAGNSCGEEVRPLE